MKYKVGDIIAFEYSNLTTLYFLVLDYFLAENEKDYLLYNLKNKKVNPNIKEIKIRDDCRNTRKHIDVVTRKVNI
jgi:hypothetical protein